jgi:hypothetical protein
MYLRQVSPFYRAGCQGKNSSQHVLAIRAATEGRQGAPLSEHCRKAGAVRCSARSRIWARSTTADMRRGADLIEAFDEGSARYRQLAFTPHGGAIRRDLCLCGHAAGGRRRASDDEYTALPRPLEGRWCALLALPAAPHPPRHT